MTLKKILTCLFAMSVFAFSASAREIALQEAPQSNLQVEKTLLTGGTEDGYNINFFGKTATYYYFEGPGTYRCYITVPGDVASLFAGNKLTGVGLSLSSKQGKNAKFKGSIFIEENGKTLDMTDVTFVNNNQESDPNVELYQEHSFTTPYTIKANQSFTYGYIVESTAQSGDWFIPIGTSPASNLSGVAEFNEAGTGAFGQCDLKTLNKSLAMYGITKGDIREIKDLFAISVDTDVFYSMNLVMHEKPVAVPITIANYGDNEISPITYNVIIDGVEEGPYEFTAPIPNGTANAYVAVYVKPGRFTMQLHITKVGSVDVDVRSVEYELIACRKIWDRQSFVSEIFTNLETLEGPISIVGINKMEEAKGDHFIGLTNHIKLRNTGDEFYFDDAQQLYNTLRKSTQIPVAVVNRDARWSTVPPTAYNRSGDWTNLLQAYKDWMPQYAAAKLDLKVNAADADGWNVTVNTTFDFTENDADYKLALILVEDGIEAEMANGFDGSSMSTDYIDNFATLGNPARAKLRNTVRSYCGYPLGIPESIPTSVVVDEPVEFTFDVPRAGISGENDAYIVALLLDGRSGFILEGAKMKCMTGVPGALKEVEIENSDATVGYYNLQGVKVNNPQSGQVYIKVESDSVKKVIF